MKTYKFQNMTKIKWRRGFRARSLADAYTLAHKWMRVPVYVGEG